MFSEVANKRYLLPRQELIYKRLVDYFSGFTAKSKNNSFSISNDEKNNSGKTEPTELPYILRIVLISIRFFYILIVCL